MSGDDFSYPDSCFSVKAVSGLFMQSTGERIADGFVYRLFHARTDVSLLRLMRGLEALSVRQ